MPSIGRLIMVGVPIAHHVATNNPAYSKHVVRNEGLDKTATERHDSTMRIVPSFGGTPLPRTHSHSRRMAEEEDDSHTVTADTDDVIHMDVATLSILKSTINKDKEADAELRCAFRGGPAPDRLLASGYPIVTCEA